MRSGFRPGTFSAQVLQRIDVEPDGAAERPLMPGGVAYWYAIA